MKTNINCVLFEFDPVCIDCKTNQNCDDSESPLQNTMIGIMESGWPICVECGSDLIIENECEVRA